GRAGIARVGHAMRGASAGGATRGYVIVPCVGGVRGLRQLRSSPRRHVLARSGNIASMFADARVVAYTGGGWRVTRRPRVLALLEVPFHTQLRDITLIHGSPSNTPAPAVDHVATLLRAVASRSMTSTKPLRP